LVFEINADWDDVGRTRVVEEPTDVAIEVRVDAMLEEKLKSNSNSKKFSWFPHIWCTQVEEVAVVSPSIRLLVRQNLTDVLRNERSLTNPRQTLHPEAFVFVIALEHDER
jgi:hypothetical protein